MPEEGKGWERSAIFTQENLESYTNSHISELSEKIKTVILDSEEH
jgi:hypothetical protein